MSVPTTMLVKWERDLVQEMTMRFVSVTHAISTVYSEIEPIPGPDVEDLDYVLASAERLVILARAAVELRAAQRENEPR